MIRSGRAFVDVEVVNMGSPRGEAVMEWPEFRALCDRLGIQDTQQTRSVTIRVAVGEVVTITHELIGDDCGPRECDIAPCSGWIDFKCRSCGLTDRQLYANGARIPGSVMCMRCGSLSCRMPGIVVEHADLAEKNADTKI